MTRAITTKLRAFLTTPGKWLILILAFHFLFNIWWLRADNHAISTDEETHMIMARDYYSALFPSSGDRSLGARLAALGRIKADVGNPVHPPLLHLAGAFLARLLGYGIDRMAFANTLSLVAALVGFYLLARRFLETGDAVFATAVFSLTPMIYMASRYFMTDFMSMALVIWVIYALWRSEGYANRRWTVLFGLFNGLALLTRTTAVLYYAVPCMMAGILGLYGVMERDPKWRFNRMGLGKLAVNMLLAAFISLAICSPWYIVHGGQFYQHWMKPDTVGADTPLALLRRDAAPKPALSPVPQEQAPKEEGMSEKEETPAASAASETGRWRLLFQRRIPWSRYPVFVINNGVFLPMFLMGLAGIATAFTCRRFRKQPLLWSLAGWLLGSYYLLTIALTFSTPRYAMQALPALALFSVLPLLAMPAGRLRRVLQGAYLAILLFQYGNLTVHAYGPIAEVTLPGQWDPEFQEIYDDPGLSVYKPVLHASSAYGRMQAPMTENFKDRLFRAMLKTEQERPFSGIEANYARLNIRGMLFEEQHYWLDAPRKNPFRRHDIPAELEPYRNFRHYGWGKEINQILPVLPIVDYVAYTTENVSEEKEQEWLRMLEGYGFDLVERFHENRFGMVSARYYGVLARKNVPPLPQVASARDLESLSLEGLYKIRYSKQFSRLPDALKTALIGRMNGLFRQAGKPIRLNDKVDFLGASVAHEQGDWYSINLIFRSSAQEKLPYRLMFQGIVTPEYMASQFNKLDGKHGQFRWTFEPSPSIPLWPENEYLLLRFPLNVKKIPYDMSFAFYLPGAGVWGDALKLGRIDFNSVALNR